MHKLTKNNLIFPKLIEEYLMKIIKSLPILFIIFFFYGCCNCSNKDAVDTSNKNTPPSQPASIQTNKTIAEVQVLSMDVKSETDYTAKIAVTKIFEDDAYPSIAVINGQYEILPNFRLGENKELLNNDENQTLKEFSKKKAGDKVKIEFFLSDTKWILHKVLK